MGRKDLKIQENAKESLVLISSVVEILTTTKEVLTNSAWVEMVWGFAVRPEFYWAGGLYFNFYKQNASINRNAILSVKNYVVTIWISIKA